MSVNNRVIWEEGLFIRPHHFQQESRYLEYHADRRLDSQNEFSYGLTKIEFDNEYLNFGKLVIVSASGVMPDGTVFDIPEDPPPAPLTIEDVSAINQTVYLALPIRSHGVNEVSWPETHSANRYQVEQINVKDVHSRDGDFFNVNVAKPRFTLMLEHEDRSSYTTLAISRILDKHADGSIQVDEAFYPTSLSVNAIPALKRFLGEVSGLMRERARNLAARIGSPSQTGVAEVTDFMLLQSLNRLQPKFQHLSRLRALHPERLFEAFAEACGELSTYQTQERIPDEYPAYDHVYPKLSFIPLEDTLRKSLGTLAQPRAVSIPIVKKGFGVHTATVADLALLENSDFVLAIKARMHLEQLRQLFLQQAKVASLEKLSDLVNLQLPGIPLSALPVAPRYLPYHAGFTYFQLDRNSEEWNQMIRDTTGFALHIAGDFPELEMEFWAIRRD